jgi:allophanate hydrolase
VGIKPTRGVVSTVGVVPACRSWDVVTIFARDLGTANDAMAVMAGGEGTRPWPSDAPLAAPTMARVAIPADLPGMSEPWVAAFVAATDRLRDQGSVIESIDLGPFLDAARLLYEGALVAERHAAVGTFVDAHRDAVDPTVGAIIGAAGQITATDLLADLDRLEHLRQLAMTALAGFDALLVPTAPGQPTIAEVDAEPVSINTWLGTYTNFCNLFDLTAVAVPSGTVVEPDGTVAQFGVTVLARPFHDAVALDLADRVTIPADSVAADAAAPPRALTAPWTSRLSTPTALFVVGAHLPGQPLAGELERLGARWIGEASTAPEYALRALDTEPPKPGLVHVGAGGSAIVGGLWEVPTSGLGRFLTDLPAPMNLGSSTLADGSRVVGFGRSAAAVAAGADITEFGGWLAWLESKA